MSLTFPTLRDRFTKAVCQNLTYTVRETTPFHGQKTQGGLTGGRKQASRGGAAVYGCWPGVGGQGWAELAGRLGRPSRVSRQLQNPDPQGPVPDFRTYCFLNNPTQIRYRTPPGNPVFVNTRPPFSGGADGRTGQPRPVECQLICVGKHGPGLLRKTSNIKYHKSRSQ